MEEIAKRRGKPFETVLRNALERASNGNEPTEEMKREAELDRLSKVEKELAERNERDARAAKEAEERHAAEVEAYYINSYKQSVVNALSAEHHPMMMTLQQGEILEKVLAAADYIAGQTGSVPDPAELLAEFERDEVEKFEARAAKAGYTREQIQAAVVEAQEDAERADAMSKGESIKDTMKKAKKVQFSSAEPDLHVREADGRVITPGTPVVRPPMGNRDAAESGGTGKRDWKNMSRRERIEQAGKEVFGKRNAGA